MNPRAIKFIRFDRLNDHFKQGWIVLIPNMPAVHDYYGCELGWICDCPVPGGFTSDKQELIS